MKDILFVAYNTGIQVCFSLPVKILSYGRLEQPTTHTHTHTHKTLTFLSIENHISNSLFSYLILKKENKQITVVFECKIKKTQ